MITLILVLALVGFLVWAIVTYVPMPQPFKVGIMVIAVVLVILYVMRVLGLSDIPLR
jgi:hypothetical protein